MKPLQLLAVLVTLIVCVAVLAWVAKALPLLYSQPETAKATPEVPQPTEPEEPVDPDKDHYSSNPFEPATGANLPHAELVEKEFQFGRMGLGRVGEHDFVVKNTGTAPLKIARGPTQCKCTVSGLKDREIPPGGQANIHLAWEPKSTGPFAQNATIWTNDPKHPVLKVGVSGDMFDELVITPIDGWVLGNLSNSKPVQLLGFVESPVIEKFKVTDVKTSSDRLKMKAVPMTEQELNERDVLSGYRLEGELAGIEDPGKVTESVTVSTDLEKYPKFEMSVSANRIGAITIIGPNWFAGGPLLQLGSISAEQGKKIKLTVMIPPAKEELKFTDVQANPGFLKLELKPEQTGKDLARERYSLFVEVPPGSPTGLWNSGRPGEIQIHTNHPQVPELDIKVHVDVR